MKIHNVPQDDAQVYEGKTKSIQYAVDENGNYVQVKSFGLEPANIVLNQAWQEVNEEIKFALEDVRNGKKSPIFYFMKKEIMDLKILSEYVGIPKWQIKRHLKPKVFSNLNDKILHKYKEAFKLNSINELKDFQN